MSKGYGKTVLLDADLLCYISHNDDDPAEHVLRSIRIMIEDIMTGTQGTSLRCILSSSRNFRYDIDPEYKANRKGVPKPRHYNVIKRYLTKYYNAEVAPDGLEADDYIAQIMFDDSSNHIIASVDKDFLTVSGWHYKWRFHGAGTPFFVTPEDAEMFLCYQLLVGDKADAIISPLKTLKKNGEYSKTGYGHVAARDFLLKLEVENMESMVYHLYCEQGYMDMFEMNYKLLAIGRFNEGFNEA